MYVGVQGIGTSKLELEFLRRHGVTHMDTTIDPDDAGETTTLPDARPPGEVTVRVGNGARRAGVVGAGTETLEAAGYPSLPPKNGPTMDGSVVYYVSGYEADAAKVADVRSSAPSATKLTSRSVERRAT